MAIARDSTGSGTNGGSSPTTFSHTCTGSNLILFVGVRTDVAVTGVTYAGVAMTKLNEISNGGIASFWYLINPSTGANNVVVTGAGAGYQQCAAVSYTGVKQSSFPDASNSATLTGTPITAAVTTIADNCWVVGLGVDNNGSGIQSAGTSTSLFFQQNNNILWVDTNAVVHPAGSRTIAVNDTSGSAVQTFIIASMAPFVTPSGPANVKTFDGVTQSTGIKTYLGVALASTKTVDGIA